MGPREAAVRQLPGFAAGPSSPGERGEWVKCGMVPLVDDDRVLPRLPRGDGVRGTLPGRLAGRPTPLVVFGQDEASARDGFVETLCGIVFGKSRRTRKKIVH